LEKYISNHFDPTITSIVPIPSASSWGAAKYLAVVADGYLGVIESNTLTAPGGYLKTESGDYVTTEDGERITVSTASVPDGCFLLVRNGKIYGITTSAVYTLDPVSGEVNAITAHSGSVPTGCTFGTLYRDRLILAGGDNAIYLSRQGDPEDWDYGADLEDAGRPTVLQLSGGGEIGETATALIAHEDSYLLAATERGLWVLQGDPCVSGTRRCITRNVGIISDSAWCKVDDTIVFLAKDGLYSISVNGSNLTPLSDDRIPVELQDIDTATTTIRMAHKNDENGVHLFLTPSSGIGQHWFFDLKERGFWLDAMQQGHQPTAVSEIDGDVVLACQDGYLRSIGGDDDDGADIHSHLLLGPLRISRDPGFGLISNIHGCIGTGSGNVTWRVVVGDTADEAVENAKAAVEAYRDAVDTTGFIDAFRMSLGWWSTGVSTNPYSQYVRSSGTWRPGRSGFSYPRTKAMWAVLWLHADSQWAFESIVMETQASGRWR
jgi:hypothetical protein